MDIVFDKSTGSLVWFLGPFLVFSELAQISIMASKPNTDHSPSPGKSTECGDLVGQILRGRKSQSVTIVKPQEEKRGSRETSESNLAGRNADIAEHDGAHGRSQHSQEPKTPRSKGQEGDVSNREMWAALHHQMKKLHESSMQSMNKMMTESCVNLAQVFADTLAKGQGKSQMSTQLQGAARAARPD